MKAIDVRINYELRRKQYKRYFKGNLSYIELCHKLSHSGCPSSLGFKKTCNADCSTCWEREAKLKDESD